MSRRYLFLFVAIVVAAAALSLLRRLPQHAPSASTEPVAAAPRTSLELTIDGAEVTPSMAQVEKGFEVDLVVVNRRKESCRLTLSGYEDRLAATIGAGERRAMRFLADRPGEGFAWIVDDQPAGRLVVAGSHLVEGHR